MPPVPSERICAGHFGGIGVAVRDRLWPLATKWLCIGSVGSGGVMSCRRMVFAGLLVRAVVVVAGCSNDQEAATATSSVAPTLPARNVHRECHFGGSTALRAGGEAEALTYESVTGRGFMAASAA